jgi:hypothetical protein
MSGVGRARFGAEISQLPRIDEHTVSVDAEPARVWSALGDLLRRSPATVTSLGARLLGAHPAVSAGDPLEAGATVPGFTVVRAAAPVELALQGRHRFSRYALIFRLDAVAGRTILRAETRAAFPGASGRLYRALVIGTRGHAVVVHAMLRTIRRLAERRQTVGGAT